MGGKLELCCMYFVNVEGIQVNKLFFVMPRTPTL